MCMVMLLCGRHSFVNKLIITKNDTKHKVMTHKLLEYYFISKNASYSKHRDDILFVFYPRSDNMPMK